MIYFDFYNNKTRHWLVKDFRKHCKDNNLSLSQESFSLLRAILTKKKVNNADRQCIIDLGFYLESNSSKVFLDPVFDSDGKIVSEKASDNVTGFYNESHIERQINSDAELMSMTRDELAASWKDQRILIKYGDIRKSYRFTGSLEDYKNLQKRFFDKIMSKHVKDHKFLQLRFEKIMKREVRKREIIQSKYNIQMKIEVNERYSDALVDSCLTFGCHKHIAHKTKYHLNDDVKNKTFVEQFRIIFLGHKKDSEIAGAILEAFDVGLTYSTCFLYLKPKL